MVCCEEGSAQCIILNMMPGANTKRITLMVRPSNKVSTLFNDIKNQMQVDNFDISMHLGDRDEEEVIEYQPQIDHFNQKIEITLFVLPFL